MGVAFVRFDFLPLELGIKEIWYRASALKRNLLHIMWMEKFTCIKCPRWTANITEFNFTTPQAMWDVASEQVSQSHVVLKQRLIGSDLLWEKP